ncbi:MFS transporter [Paenarthrobacter sp. NPDC090520]|uniref:MFS transporter n=1 Tax=Paenarthrobacter sp. NPDC090520 TaxID=3364382 RepID=UPI003800C6A2
MTVMMAGASAPSPFYPTIQEKFGLAPVILTLVFAVYAVALLATLLLAGSMSDYLGRRPVVSAGFFLLAGSLVLFWLAGDSVALMFARLLQGIASGLLLSALGAAIADLEPSGEPGAASAWNSLSALAGLAFGALAAGFSLLVLGETGGSAVTFVSLSVSSLMSAGATWLLPETSTRRKGIWRSLLPRISVPLRGRKHFLDAIPVFASGWATGGLYLSLGTSLLTKVFEERSPFNGWLVVTLLAGSGALMGFLARRWKSKAISLYGAASLAAGSALTIVSVLLGSQWLFHVAVVITGTGFGTAFPGALHSILTTVEASRRAETMSAVFVVCYLAFSVPAVAAGAAVPVAGLSVTVLWYAGAVALLAISSVVLILMRRDHTSGVRECRRTLPLDS